MTRNTLGNVAIFVIAAIVALILSVGIIVSYGDNKATACEAKGGELVGADDVCLKKEVVIHL